MRNFIFGRNVDPRSRAAVSGERRRELADHADYKKFKKHRNLIWQKKLQEEEENLEREKREQEEARAREERNRALKKAAQKKADARNMRIGISIIYGSQVLGMLILTVVFSIVINHYYKAYGESILWVTLIFLVSFIFWLFSVIYKKKKKAERSVKKVSHSEDIAMYTIHGIDGTEFSREVEVHKETKIPDDINKYLDLLEKELPVGNYEIKAYEKSMSRVLASATLKLSYPESKPRRKKKVQRSPVKQKKNKKKKR